jgi:hypothetical protein
LFLNQDLSFDATSYGLYLHTSTSADLTIIIN